jgi:hypothetical protein
LEALAMITLDSRYTVLAGSIVATVVAGTLYFCPYITPHTQFLVSLACYLFLMLTLISEQWSPMYVLRFFLLSGSGVIPPLLLFLVGDGTKVMNYALALQSRETAGHLLLLAMLALSGSALGWRVGCSLGSNPTLKIRWLDIEFTEDRSAFYLAVFGVSGFAAATMLASSLGPYLWEASYTQQASTQMFGLTAYNMLCTLSVLIIFAIAVCNRFKSLGVNALAMFMAVYVLIECMLLRGMRAEVVGTLFGGFMLYSIFYRKRLSGYVVISAFSFGFVFVYLWGSYRATAASGFSLYDAFAFMLSSARSYDYLGNDLYQTGTFGDISATFFNAVALIESRAMGLLYGSSYFDFIPRTLPALLYPDRPRDLSFVFYDVGIAYGGGIFELAEAYLNWAAAGCFLVPFAISSLLGAVYELALAKPNVLRLAICGVFAGSIFRGTLYQSFVFYRAATVFLAFLGLAELFYQVKRRTSQWASRLKSIN